MSSFSEGFFYFLAPLYAKIRKGGEPEIVANQNLRRNSLE